MGNHRRERLIVDVACGVATYTKLANDGTARVVEQNVYRFEDYDLQPKEIVQEVCKFYPDVVVLWL